MQRLCFRCPQCYRIITLANEGPCLYCGKLILINYLEKVSKEPGLQVVRPKLEQDKTEVPGPFKSLLLNILGNTLIRVGAIFIFTVIIAYQAAFIFEEKTQEAIKPERPNRLYDMVDLALNVANINARAERAIRHMDRLDLLMAELGGTNHPGLYSGMRELDLQKLMKTYSGFQSANLSRSNQKEINELLNGFMREANLSSNLSLSPTGNTQRAIQKTLFRLLKQLPSQRPPGPPSEERE